jgi:phosphohistidine phosphatase
LDFSLVRHGEAVSEGIDPKRPLSALGREDVVRVARLAVEKQVRVSAIYHSGILRAQQTADILGERLHPPSGVSALSGLQPMDDPASAAAELATATEPIMLVGHMPFMARLSAPTVIRSAALWSSHPR